jgi:2-amino-4-hydroxy-6-hydroxymethyldihydropteridine diphosphokinase
VKYAYIGLGSNQGDRRSLLAEASGRLDRLPGTRMAALSPIYRTSPVGEDVGEEFLNAVARLDTALPPRDLLAGLLAIEKELGRTRLPQRPAARPIDLDLLLYGELALSLAAGAGNPALTLPHPRMSERLFVLAPLADLAPDLVVPGTGKTVSALLAAARNSYPEQDIAWYEAGGAILDHP